MTGGGILDERVEFVVDGDAEHVEVGRSHPHPAPVHDARLGVHHLALPFPDSDAVGEQPAIIAPREQGDPGMVVAARHEHADVDAVARRPRECLDLGPGGREVGARDPDGALRGGRLHLQRTRDAEPQRLPLDDTDEGRRMRGRIEMRAGGALLEKAV